MMLPIEYNKIKAGSIFFLRFVNAALLVFLFTTRAEGQQAVEVRRYTIDDSIHLQGIAVDKDFFYVISTNAILKYEKKGGQKVKEWNGKKDDVIKHLNSGVVIKNKLYCAHSNFPQSPMASSVEVFDTKTLEHIDSHSFGIFGGSATWIDEKDGYWWVAFANYSGEHSSEGRDNRWTQLVKFTKDWKVAESWIYPKNILEAFDPFSNSGGVWSRTGQLYISGHDRKEVYVMKLPESGFTLQYIKTIEVVNNGQGLALDKSDKANEILYAVSRDGNAIVVEQL